MSNNYFDSLKALTGVVNTNFQNVMQNGIIQKAMTGINDMLTSLRDRTASMALLCEGFSCTDALVPDTDDPSGYSADIMLGDEAHDILLEMTQKLYDQYPNGLTLTDNNGLCYSLRFSGSAQDPEILNDYGENLTQSILSFDPVGAHFNSDIHSTFDHVLPMYQLIAQQFESLWLNRGLIGTCELLLQKGANIAASDINNLRLTLNTKFESVKELLSNIVAAFNSGGWKGVIAVISQYFSAGKSITSDGGTLIFTDNSALVPQQYIVGIIPQVITIVSTAAAIVASYFAPWLGLLIMGAGQVVAGVVKSIAYDAAATSAGLQMSDKVYFSACPWAYDQGRMNFNNFSTDDQQAISQLLSVTGVFYVCVPGGFLFVGVHSFNEDGSIKYLGYEFHPALTKIDTTNQYWQQLLSKITWDYTGTIMLKHVSITLNKAVSSNIFNHYAEMALPADFEVNDNYRFTNSSDQDFKEHLGYNVFLYYYWRLASGSTDNTVIDTSSVNFSACCKWPSSATVPANKDWYTVDSENWSLLVSRWYLLLYSGCPGLDYTYTDTFGLQWHFIGNMQRKFSWELIAKIADDNDYITVAPPAGAMPSGRLILADRTFFDNPYIMPASFDYAVVPAKYDASTFLKWIIFTAVVTIAVVAVTVVGTIKFSRWRCHKRAQNAARVESAWSRLTSDPSVANAEAYRKEVKRANRWRILVGGSKFSTSNYWDGDIGSSTSGVESNDAVSANIDFVISLIKG